jgi:acyl-CoA thioesterase FadM
VITRRVGMGDVDRMQVWFGTHVGWMDEAHMDLLASLGHPLLSCLAAGFATPVAALSMRYVTPVELDDEVEIEPAVTRVGRTSFDVTHVFRHGGEVIAEGVATHVWMQLDGRLPAPVPEWLRSGAEGGRTWLGPRSASG